MQDTKEILSKFIQKCRQDPIFFIENFVRPPDNPEQPMKLSEKQKEIVRSYLNDHYVIILGSRQTGKTTVTIAYLLWLLLFFPGYRAAILSRDGDHAKDIVRDLMGMYEYLPDFLKIGLEKDVEFEKIFKNRSWLKAFTVPKSNPEKIGRGLRAGFILIDEAAFIPHIERIYTALAPTTSRLHPTYAQRGYPYGIAIISTPNKTYGLGRWFYLQWIRAKNGESVFKPITYHWSETGFYDEEWAKKEREKYTEEEWLQEYELVFLSGGSSFLPLEITNKLTQKEFEPIWQKTWLGDKYKFFQYDEPSGKNPILIGVDTASEDGLSEQAIVVTELLPNGTLKVLAEGYGKVPFDEFCKIVVEIADKFSTTEKLTSAITGNMNLPSWFQAESKTERKITPFLFIERNYLGEALIAYIRDQFPDLYERVYASTKTSANGKITYVDGIQTTSKTRTLILDSVYKYVTENEPVLDDILKANKLRIQLAALERNDKGKITAPPDVKDDLIFALGFILYAMSYDEDNFVKQVLARKTINDKEVQDYLQLLKRVS